MSDDEITELTPKQKHEADRAKCCEDVARTVGGPRAKLVAQAIDALIGCHIAAFYDGDAFGAEPEYDEPDDEGGEYQPRSAAELGESAQ